MSIQSSTTSKEYKRNAESRNRVGRSSLDSFDSGNVSHSHTPSSAKKRKLVGSECASGSDVLISGSRARQMRRDFMNFMGGWLEQNDCLPQCATSELLRGLKAIFSPILEEVHFSVRTVTKVSMECVEADEDQDSDDEGDSEGEQANDVEPPYVLEDSDLDQESDLNPQADLDCGYTVQEIPCVKSDESTNTPLINNDLLQLAAAGEESKKVLATPGHGEHTINYTQIVDYLPDCRSLAGVSAKERIAMVARIIPMKSKKDFDFFNDALEENKDLCSALVEKYWLIAGDETLAKRVYLYMRIFISKVLATQINWNGTNNNGKFGIGNSRFKDLIFRLVRASSKFAETNDEKIKNSMQVWMQNGTARTRIRVADYAIFI
ncbi:Hypothetical predicted protein [Cloeon dipterum]|uniref:DUF4806 domain-containing protein n=1 Tax=Cloeon dipterum TaxID=197152 RepID=A0A8S1D1L7_9INSE|nr:Hypothetical predicted protein [Cloeon dipterum]